MRNEAEPTARWLSIVVDELLSHGLQIEEREPGRFGLGAGTAGEASQMAARRFFDGVILEVAPLFWAGTTVDERAYAAADVACQRLARAAGDDAQRSAIEDVQANLSEAAKSLRVEHRVKETSAYRARLVHQMRPPRLGPLKAIQPTSWRFVVLEFEDKKTGERGEAHVLDYNHREDLRSVAGSVTVKGDVIAVNPQRGHEFGTPILIERSALVRLSPRR